MSEKILFTDEMKCLDNYTCERKKISSLQLMEIAGKNLYECFIKNWKINKTKDNILVVAGLGNNGGDALVVSEYLIMNNYKTNIVIIGNLNKLSNESSKVYRKLVDKKISIFNITNKNDLNLFKDLLDDTKYIIDGIFGIGLSRKINGIFYECIKLINKSQANVFSIDIPSGIYGDSGNIANIAVKANLTAIIQNYKIGNLLNDAKDYHGEIILLDIGILQDINKSNKILLDENVRKLINKRKANTHKYNYGSILTIGGSIGMTGAPLLSAYSALRIGGGLSTIGINSKYYEYIKQIYPEIMIRPFSSIDELNKILIKKNVIAFGPGLGRNDTINYDILKLLLDTKTPLVIDADGIFYLKKYLNDLNNNENIIITPHLGEMALLLDSDIDILKKDPVKAINYITNNYGINVVLKGTCTIIANKEKMYFSNMGNPGMATAGSGDVLTGIISGLIGQGIKPFDACKLGVFVHSKAGDLAYEEYGYSLIATDIINNLPKVLKAFIN